MALTLEDIVNEYLIEIGELTPHKFARALQFGINALREFHLDTTGIPKATFLNVNANYTVDLPSDFISHVRISVCSGGNLESIWYNKDMCLPRDYDDCGDIKAVGGGGASAILFGEQSDHFTAGEVTGRYFGVGGTSSRNGFYRIDKANGFIALQSFNGDKVYLEYLAELGRNSDGKFDVHPYLYEAVKAFIHWKMFQRNKRSPMGKSQEAYMDYKREKNKAENRYASFTFDEIKQVVRSNFVLTPRT